MAEILQENKKKKYDGKKARIERTISELIRIHCKYSNEYEIAWALWLAKEFEIKINTDLYTSLSKLDNPAIVLLILDLRDKELIKQEIDESKWKKFFVKNSYMMIIGY